MNNDFLLEMFKRNNEIYRNRIVDYRFLNDNEILVRLDDGTQILYDYILNGKRYIKYKGKLTDEENKKEFRFRLRAMILHSGISQKDFAERIGITEVSLSRYLNGQRIPTFVILKKMANVLHCKVDDFYFEPLE